MLVARTQEQRVHIRLTVGLVAGAFVALAVLPVAAQISREQYLQYLPLEYPTIIRETLASRKFQLYGDQDSPTYRDVAPRDGIDDRRAAWLNGLGVRLAPLMVRNTAYAPTDFRD